MREGLKTLAERYAKYGYPTLRDMLRIEGRLSIASGHTGSVARKACRSAPRNARSSFERASRCSYPIRSTSAGRWILSRTSWLAGRRLPTLKIVDDFSRECVLRIVDFSISGDRLARERDRLSGSLPRTIVCDNDPESGRKATRHGRSRDRLICSIRQIQTFSTRAVRSRWSLSWQILAFEVFRALECS